MSRWKRNRSNTHPHHAELSRRQLAIFEPAMPSPSTHVAITMEPNLAQLPGWLVTGLLSLICDTWAAERTLLLCYVRSATSPAYVFLEGDGLIALEPNPFATGALLTAWPAKWQCLLRITTEAFGVTLFLTGLLLFALGLRRMVLSGKFASRWVDVLTTPCPSAGRRPVKQVFSWHVLFNKGRFKLKSSREHQILKGNINATSRTDLPSACNLWTKQAHAIYSCSYLACHWSAFADVWSQTHFFINMFTWSQVWLMFSPNRTRMQNAKMIGQDPM